ncbi:LPS assembly outer membrane protein LptD (organic solvent tolerance protein OstA) [Abditibacterium utsteinense]|uniref:LPS assembly outer membrane protein LptD (Organic solvent tolerance protein OstA) n=1 Tax=Abditibacterium utsteinense TaxID=1960156 RepID=A0A2S8SPL1_9BACT|nr:hypothetical protein [Abditibacterium utsteinense]PQV62728.1 LPS assembly outer membrane protein LptD (organic solvent tolerance protein OstA) [Abditibacterium utsteinense]
MKPRNFPKPLQKLRRSDFLWNSLQISRGAFATGTFSLVLIANAHAQTATSPTATPPTATPAATPDSTKNQASAPTKSPAKAPTPVPTPALQSPVTSPNTDAPDIPPPPGLPDESAPASADPAAQNQQFENPNQIVPAPPLAPIGVADGSAQIASETPNGPPIPPGAAPVPTPNPPNSTSPNSGATTNPAPGATAPGAALPGEAPTGGDIQSGTEEPGGDYSLQTPAGGADVVYDMERGLALAPNGAIFKYREFTVRGDKGIVDFNTNRAILNGNLTVSVRGQTFTGNSLTFNIDSGKWTLSSLAITFPPELFPEGTVLSPLYVRDGSVSGDFDTATGRDFKFTSCDRDHYYIKSKKLEFYRNKGGEPSRVVLRRNAVYILGRRILPLPVYVISLLGADARRQPLQATFGQNATDGFFARSLYDLRATPKFSESLLIDTLQKRGLGLGFQRQYAATAGLLYLYSLNGRNGERETNARVDRTYKLSKNITSNIRFDSAQNRSASTLDTASSQSKTQNGTFSFARAGEQAQTNAVFSFNNSSYGFGESKNGAISLDHRQAFGSGYNLEATAQLTRSQTGAGENFAGSDSATSDNTFVLSKIAKPFDLFLRADMHQDLVAKKSYNLERLPELTLQSSTQRLPIPGLKDFLPGSFTLAMGRFNEPSSDQQKDRADFFYTPTDRNYRLLGNGKSVSTLGASGNFEQAFYSDSTARYNYAYNLISNSTAGPAQLQINYSKQRTHGFTPFQFDFFTPGEYLDYTFSLQSGEKYRFNLTGGRDIQNGYTRDIIARAQFSPTPRIYASLGTSFRLQNDENSAPGSRFGEVYANVRLNRNRNRFAGGGLAFGVRYSPQTSQITRANASVDINLGSRTRVQGLAGYDGFSKTFDFTQFRVTRDLHCFNLFATYDGQRKEVRLDIAIKAFPFADTRFGRNEFSEGFDASVGDIQ